MLKKTVITSAIIFVVLAAVLFILMKGPDLSSYEPLREPRIATMQDRKMLVVEAKGDPNVVGKEAFGLLFRTYYRIEGVPKWPNQPAPRARWSGDMNDKTSWTGRYALPVPDKVSALPAVEAEPGLTAALVTWEYGTVAEILHVGPYAEEAPTIEKLMKFIRNSGYAVAGHHEEEFVKGPGMLFRGNPDTYYTVIRYRVAKAGL